VFIKKIHCSNVVYVAYKTLLDIMCLYYNNIDSSDINLGWLRAIIVMKIGVSMAFC